MKKMPEYNNFSTGTTINSKNVKEKLVEYYIQSLTENRIPWNCGWDQEQERPFNPITQSNYHGNNLLLLEFVAMIKGYRDPRWCTVKQANKEGWKIKPKSDEVKASGEIYGVPLQYWMPCIVDKRGKLEKWISWSEYNEMQKDSNATEGKKNGINLDVRSKTFYVFNAQEIEGIPEYDRPIQKTKINSIPFIENLIKQMHVKYQELGSQAYYDPHADCVVVPAKDSFYSEYSYQATRLHELCHATGHSSRLGRKIENSFGSQNYAREELRAEIASSFLSQDIGLPVSEEHLKNHAAYIQSWIRTLKKDPNELFRAIKTADDIEKYVLKTGEWEKIREKLEEKETKPELNKLNDIHIDGYLGTWHEMIRVTANDEEFIVFENDEFGNQTAFVITDKDLNPITETNGDIETAIQDYLEMGQDEPEM